MHALILSSQLNDIFQRQRLFTSTQMDAQSQLRTDLLIINLVPRAHALLRRGTKGSGIIHLIIASDWSLK